MASDPIRLPLKIGDVAYRHHTITDEAIDRFANEVQDWNKVHYGENRVAHGAMLVGYASAMLGMQFPGPGTILLGVDLRFVSPARPNDTLSLRMEAAEIRATQKGDKAIVKVRIDFDQYNDHTPVATGHALVMLPVERVVVSEENCYAKANREARERLKDIPLNDLVG